MFSHREFSLSSPALDVEGPERGCVQKHQPQHVEKSAASGVFQQAGFAKLLRLVFDTAALRGSA
jgi:hypothetical protein